MATFTEIFYENDFMIVTSAVLKMQTVSGVFVSAVFFHSLLVHIASNEQMSKCNKRL